MSVNIKKAHLKILDIDLDFFLNAKHTTSATGSKRLNPKYYIPWSAQRVKTYLESKAGLNSNKPIRGKIFTKHDELFIYLKSLQESANFQLTFEIDHVDAHADLGVGDSSYTYIACDILSRPVNDRCYINLIGGRRGLSEGNYLMFLIACRWLTKLNYINHFGWTDDIPWFAFKNFNINSGAIQLKQYSEDQLHQMLYEGNMRKIAKSSRPISIEPQVAFKRINANRFKSIGDYDLVFFTQSPYYTPVTSDALIPIITSYMSLS